MRWVALAIILASLPAFVAILGQNRARRDLAMMALGLLNKEVHLRPLKL